MSEVYRVLVIDDQKEVTDRIKNICQADHSQYLDGGVKVEVESLYVEVIPRKDDDTKFEISDKTIEELIRLSSKRFNHIFTDFGFVSNSNIYDDLAIDDVGEIELTSLQNKVFTPADLILKAKNYISKKRKTKQVKQFETNFFQFNGKLSLYSYWDKRFNKVYHSLGERQYITENVFPKAVFDKLYDVKKELFDNNDSYKQDEHYYAFLKCKFISQQIQISISIKETLECKNEGTQEILKYKNDENPFFSIKNFFLTWKTKFWSWLHWKVVIFWLMIIGVFAVAPLFAITHPRSLDSFFKISSDYHPIMIIVSLSYITIIIGTTLYAIDVFLQTHAADKKIKWIGGLYGISLLVCAVSVFICWRAFEEIRVKDDIKNIVEITEYYTMGIFAALLIIDILMIIAKFKEINYYKANLNNNEFRKSLIEKSFILNQLLFIDIPVLLGVLFIFAYTHSASDFYETTHNEKDLYKTFLAVGGIGMHIIFSQFIFVVLNTKMAYSEIIEKTKESE